MVYGEGDVETWGAVELDVGAFEEFEGGFIEAAFCGNDVMYISEGWGIKSEGGDR